jgi:hypothetical protein
MRGPIALANTHMNLKKPFLFEMEVALSTETAAPGIRTECLIFGLFSDNLSDRLCSEEAEYLPNWLETKAATFWKGRCFIGVKEANDVHKSWRRRSP